MPLVLLSTFCTDFFFFFFFYYYYYFFFFFQEFQQHHILRLRVDQMPKSVITCKNEKGQVVKKRGLDKEVVKGFFKPINCASIRKNTKNKFEFFVGFLSDKDFKQALMKDKSFLGESNFLRYLSRLNFLYARQTLS